MQRRPIATSIAFARFPADEDEVRTLFREYMDSLGIDLCFQNAAAELAVIPGRYEAPAGAVLLARAARQGVVGCVAMRPGARAGDGEMKRLYVRPAARGQGFGRQLAVALIAQARTQGYARLLLDTLAHMASAQRLYATLGFRQVAAYYDNPLPGTVYMALDLRGR